MTTIIKFPDVPWFEFKNHERLKPIYTALDRLNSISINSNFRRYALYFEDTQLQIMETLHEAIKNKAYM